MMRSSFLESLPPRPNWLRRQPATAAASPSADAPLQHSDLVNGINVSLEDRWLLLGMTDCGKTTFAKALINHLHDSYEEVPVHILDTKASGDFREWYSGLITSDDVPDPIESGFQVWQPGVDNQDRYDQWFERILHAPGPAILLIDEISSLGKGKSNDAPPHFQRLLKQGRALNKSVINCSQEMAYAPRQIKTQTTHIVRFRMAPGFDPIAANKLMGRPPGDPEPRSKYGFYYGRTNKPGKVIEYSTYHDFF